MSRVLQRNCHRITSASNLIFTTNPNFEPLRKGRDLRKCNSAGFATKSAEAINENVTVEDLEGIARKAFNGKILHCSATQQSTELVQEARDLYNRILDDVLAGRDLQVYQGSDFEDFFGEAEPKRVSEVCLVNDHFMLVKMPETCWRRSSQIESIAEEELENEDGLKLVETREAATELVDSRHNKAKKYFRCSRSSKVLPMHSKLEESQNSVESDTINVLCNNKKSELDSTSWNSRDEAVEVHKSITKIIRDKVGSTKRDTEKHTIAEVYRTTTKISGKSKKKFNNTNEKATEGVETQSQKKIQLDSLHSKNKLDEELDVDSPINKTTKKKIVYNSSLKDSVSLNYTTKIITPTRKNLLNGFSNETGYMASISEKRKQSKKSSRFNGFRWLLKPFRLRSQRKPKAKIHAVINKTYFIHWKRPPDDQKNHFGDKLQVTEMPTLKRSRSATF